MDDLDSKMTFQERLSLLLIKAKKSPITIEQLLTILSGKGQPLILILLCLPFCQPIQIPGLSVPFGLAIAIVGLRMTIGGHAWLPKKVLATQIKSDTLKKMAESTLWFIKKARFFIRPRLLWATQTGVMKRINGLMIVALGLFLALPLPIPFSNLVAAWAIFCIALGVLEDDGIFVLLGYLIALFGLAILVFLIVEFKVIFSKFVSN